MLTSSAPALGDTLRFYGLVFDDHGTLRMDCAQISSGGDRAFTIGVRPAQVASGAVAGDSGKSTWGGMLRAPVGGRPRDLPEPLPRCAAHLGPSPASVCLAFPAMDLGQGSPKLRAKGRPANERRHIGGPV
jgi:hypothetical protein